MKKKLTTIQLKFSVDDDDPRKNEIMKKFGELLDLIQREDGGKRHD